MVLYFVSLVGNGTGIRPNLCTFAQIAGLRIEEGGDTMNKRY